MNAENRTIRVYQHSDKPALLKIYDAAVPSAHHFLEESVRMRHRQLAEESLDDLATKTFVLEENGIIVGFATFQTEIKMSGFFVNPELKRQGLGRKLMNYIQSEKQIIKLAVYKRNRDAVSFYKKMGFQKQSQKRENSTQPIYFEMTWKA
ncbi:GNAT family N-acetyltransferase [Stenomitos frigidus]|uniref:N-acetyltransferase domain-containing protein n=1 Tax=Stenomitos frigidus ULC18 TaxID=2107698 RepID=A0A2T1ESJ8_9CYAN|nr:GNAT family N-acetyltransferase [Stenomitos frigidus]PSB35628.1 hypothetical protein C7B82_00630 [Stenomitos frigidus ULC18]